eukprot:757823-Hanusia_phi.AAC.1
MALIDLLIDSSQVSSVAEDRSVNTTFFSANVAISQPVPTDLSSSSGLVFATNPTTFSQPNNPAFSTSFGFNTTESQECLQRSLIAGATSLADGQRALPTPEASAIISEFISNRMDRVIVSSSLDLASLSSDVRQTIPALQPITPITSTLPLPFISANPLTTSVLATHAANVGATMAIPSITAHRDQTSFASSPAATGIAALPPCTSLQLPSPALPSAIQAAKAVLATTSCFLPSLDTTQPPPTVTGSNGMVTSSQALATNDFSALTSLPEPSGLVLEDSTTTSLHIKWNPAPSLEGTTIAPNVFWNVEFCKADDTEVLGECIFMLKIVNAPVTGLLPNTIYKIRLRLELRSSSSGPPVITSPWTTAVFSTLNVSDIPVPAPRPVVHRISSTMAEVTILAAPCKKGEEYLCAESYLLQRLEGLLRDDDSREDDWKSVPEVTCSCTHPKFSDVIPSLEKKRVPLYADKTYHFRVRASNSLGIGEWSEIATILPPPAAAEVRVDSVKSLSASLVWNQPEDHGYEIQHYHVFQYKTDDESDMKEAVVPAVYSSSGSADDGRATSPLSKLVYYHAQQLQPNCSYKFFVRARSEAGLSDPSAQCDVVTQPLPPPLPTSVAVERIEPNALHFQWSMRDEAEMNVTAVCEVSWREVTQEELDACAGGTAKLARNMEQEDRETWSSKEIPCGEEIGGDYSCSIIGLMPDTLYAVQVRGKNGGGDGPWSPAVLQKTTVPPPQQPSTFYSSDTTSASTTLSWDQPLDDACPVTAYQVRCTSSGSELDQDPDTLWQTITAMEVGEGRLCYVVEDLVPGQEYAFQIRALNQVGPGEPTEPLKVTVKSDVPPPPSQPESSEQLSDAIILQWKPPMRNHGSEVTAYALQMRKDGEEEWQTVSEEITNLSVEVSCPEPRMVYHFRIRAKNALGWSEWSDSNMFETLPPPPPQPPLAVSAVMTHNSVTINWPHSQASVSGYEVQQLKGDTWVAVVDSECAVGEQLRRMKRDRRHISGCDEAERVRKRPILAFTRENLAGQTEYKFRVGAKNSGGQAFSDVIIVKTEDEKWAKHLTEEEEHRLRELCKSCGCEEYFDRFARSLYDAETLSRLPQDELREVMERMQILPKHREKLRAALSTPPGAPGRPLRSSVSYDSVVLSWDPPEPLGYPVIEYVVQFSIKEGESETRDWQEVRCGITSCKVENLLASTDYFFRVAACNEPQGQGMWSQEALYRTSDVDCEDEQLLEFMREALNTKEYADRVAAQLYHEQWTLAALQALAVEKLEDILRRMRVRRRGDGEGRGGCLVEG